MARIQRSSWRWATVTVLAVINLSSSRSIPQTNASDVTEPQIEERQILQTEETSQVVISQDGDSLLQQHPRYPQQQQVVTIPLINVRDTYFIVNITVNGHTVAVQLDTGSSDIWVAGDGYQCLTKTGEPQETCKCGLGRPFTGDVDLSSPEKKFSRYYVDGSFATGVLGEADVGLGGLVAAHQPIGIVDRSHWFSFGEAPGLLGLGYPSLTAGADGGQGYNPMFTTLWKNDVAATNFSLALSRLSSEQKSYLSFGGIPSEVDYDPLSWVSTPLIPTIEKDINGTKQHGIYAITPTGWIFSQRSIYGLVCQATWVDNTSKDNGGELPTVTIDAVSTLSILPAELVASVLASFDPPARWQFPDGTYGAPCNAKVPTLGVAIGQGKENKLFYFAKEDLLRQTERDATGKLCRVGIIHPVDYGGEYSGATPYKLGINFLTNVVATFDVGAGEMRFAKRKEH